MRKVIYTTHAIESVNARLRKIIKTRGHFPTDEAATKLIWLALRNITGDWSRANRDWKEAMNQFAVLYAERFTEVPVEDRSRSRRRPEGEHAPPQGDGHHNVMPLHAVSLTLPLEVDADVTTVDLGITGEIAYAHVCRDPSKA